MSWNTSQLAEKNVKFCTPGTQSVRKLTFLGVPSDAENRVRRRLVEFLVFNSIYLKKSVPSNGINRVPFIFSSFVIWVLILTFEYFMFGNKTSRQLDP